MNCANHADASAVAYCRTCGKPLCANCTRPVRGVIYCEECLGAKVEGVPTGAAGFAPGGFAPAAASATPGHILPPPPGSGSGPNPTVAGILGGLFPFGVGAVYTGQYAKGLAHLAIFVLLIAGANAADSDHSEALGVFCGLGIAFFIIYQIFDAVRSAKAIQMAQPVPDPFDLSATFGGGARIETSKIPMGAIVLILIGLLFLLNTLGLTEYGLDRFWPVILIVLGGWLFARNWGLLGSRDPRRLQEKMASRGFPIAAQNSVVAAVCCQCARCRTRRIMGPALLLTVGVLFLLDHSVHVARFGQTWPVILLVIGVVKLLQGSASMEGHTPVFAANPGGGPIAPTPTAPPTAPVPPTGEVNHGDVNHGEVNHGEVNHG